MSAIKTRIRKKLVIGKRKLKRFLTALKNLSVMMLVVKKSGIPESPIDCPRSTKKKFLMRISYSPPFPIRARKNPKYRSFLFLIVRASDFLSTKRYVGIIQNKNLLYLGFFLA